MSARGASTRSRRGGGAGARAGVRPYRLAPDVRPLRYALHVDLDPARSETVRGEVAIEIALQRGRRTVELHATDLRITRARVEQSGRALRAEPRLRPERETVVLELPARLAPGTATLRLRFTSRLRDDLRGLYRATAGARRYAFTQLEAAEARRFFPCFDEPALKARFGISVTTSAGHTVLSNAPVERTEPGAEGRRTTHFRETPLLSTYLVALAVGELESSRSVRLGSTAIRVWHVPGKERLTAFGLEAARECLARLERWFGLAYPYEKLDLVAVPDFEAGAMENAGAVFFRETLLLLDPRTATATEKKRVAEVICHELAHMWYGDLVTMAWWDDLWLNEAFATWMAFHVVDRWKPEWRMWQDFQHHRAAAMRLDALRHTHPIHAEVRTPNEATENFDLITYEKGASVVRMLERYLGPRVFRAGVRTYIRRHREGNARGADLWRALSEACGEPVEPIVRAWIEQAGLPLLSLRRVGRGRLELRQERFRADPLRSGRGGRRAGPTPRWPIPCVIRVGSARSRGRTQRHLLTRSRDRIALEGGRPPFVYGNADEAGFVRVAHEPSELRALATHRRRLSPVERMGLVDHQWALVRAGHAKVETFLELAASLGEEEDPDVLLTLRGPLAHLEDRVVPGDEGALREAYRHWVQEVFGAARARVGWRPSRGEDERSRRRRAVLVDLLGAVARDPEVLAWASTALESYLVAPDQLDPNLADPVASLGARRIDGAGFDRVLQASERAATPQERRRLLLALGDCERARLVDRACRLALGRRVPTQDVAMLLSRLLANREARERAWRFVRERWNSLERRMPPMLATRLIEATPALGTRAYRREVARFFREHPLPAGARTLQQSLERFDLDEAFRRAALPGLRAWLLPESSPRRSVRRRSGRG